MARRTFREFQAGLRGSGRGLLVLAMCLFAVPALAQSSQRAASTVPLATTANLQRTGETTRLVFELSDAVEPRGYVLADPDRVIVDLPEITFQIDPSVGRAPPSAPALRLRGRGIAAAAEKPKVLGGSVQSFRFGLLAPGRSRVVIDLAEPVRITRVASEPGPSGRGAQLVIELVRSDRASFVAEAARFARQPVASIPAVPLRASGPGDLPVIVLDAGHGGIDTGAHAASGALEKDIVFEFARVLAGKLEASHRYKVILTRDGDVFIPLGERVRLARAANAALFVSIHADTLSDEPGVSGATVYTVSDKASDAEAARVAEKENQADAAGGVDGREDQSDITDILFDLTRRETRAYSHVFARTLVGNWKETGRLNKNPHRSAGFKVLKAPDIPSVLLELGYLSSERDLVGLVSAEWREKATGSVAKSIDAFFKARGHMDGPQKAETVESPPIRAGLDGDDPETLAHLR